MINPLRTVVRTPSDPLPMVTISPHGGDGRHVFLNGSRDQLATYGWPGIGERVKKQPKGWGGPRLSDWLKEAPPNYFRFDDTRKPPYRLEQTLAWLKQWEGKNLLLVAINCHGWPKGLQCGFYIHNIDRVAQALAACLHPGGTVALMACSAARTPGKNDDPAQGDQDGEGPGGDGAFADELRDALCRAGKPYCVVLGHATRGHAFRNPYARRFPGAGSPVGGVGGHYIIKPRSKLWTPWRQLLRPEGPRAFQHRFLQMELDQITAEVSANL